jgi:hypothetical protein
MLLLSMYIIIKWNRPHETAKLLFTASTKVEWPQGRQIRQGIDGDRQTTLHYLLR